MTYATCISSPVSNDDLSAASVSVGRPKLSPEQAERLIESASQGHYTYLPETLVMERQIRNWVAKQDRHHLAAIAGTLIEDEGEDE